MCFFSTLLLVQPPGWSVVVKACITIIRDKFRYLLWIYHRNHIKITSHIPEWHVRGELSPLRDRQIHSIALNNSVLLRGKTTVIVTVVNWWHDGSYNTGSVPHVYIHNGTISALKQIVFTLYLTPRITSNERTNRIPTLIRNT